MGGGVNAKSFINIHQYKTFEEVLESIIYLNTHDEAYLQMLSEPVFLDVNHKDLFDKRPENFLLHIFDQPLEKAYRRGFGQWRCNIEKRYKKAQKARQIGNNIANIIQKPIRTLKKYILSAYNLIHFYPLPVLLLLDFENANNRCFLSPISKQAYKYH